MSISKSLGSSMVMTEFRVSWVDFSRMGDRKGFLSSPSSSEVSVGVKAGVRRGLGRVLGDWESVLLCLVVGELRNGRARGLWSRP